MGKSIKVANLLLKMLCCELATSYCSALSEESERRTVNLFKMTPHIWNASFPQPNVNVATCVNLSATFAKKSFLALNLIKLSE